MLYLAEVIQKKGGIIGGGKAELRLLACQRTEQNWSAVAGDEVVAADEASRYSPGTLLLVDLTASKQVQRVQEAGRPLVSILQNFSRLQEKFKTQEEEIEQWKQSLTYQSQELNRREMEMEARREQLEQLEEDFEQLEQQRHQIEGLRGEVEHKQQELDRQRQELEGAWEHLRGEMRRLEERQQEIQGSPVLDEAKTQRINELLRHIEAGILAPEGFQEDTNQAFELLSHHQTLLSQHWQNLEQEQSRAGQLQQELDHQVSELEKKWQDWREADRALAHAQSELKLQQATLQSKQEYAQRLGLQLQQHDELHQSLYRMAEGLEDVNVSSRVDTEALEKMPLEALQALVADLLSDLEKSSQFVRGQEEELDLKQQEIDALQARISQVSEFDRLTLEAELNDERDAYQFLNETLVGQRRNLREKEGLLNQHQSILARRQGKSDPHASENGLDLGPVFAQIDGFRQQLAEELQQIDAQVEQIRHAIDQAQQLLSEQTVTLEHQRRDLEQQDRALVEKRSLLGEVLGKVSLYQSLLQPLQDTLGSLYQRVEAISGGINQAQQMSQEQRQALAQVQEVLASLSQQPQLAAS